MEITTLEAKERKNIDKANTKTLRRNGKVPGVFYSRYYDPIAIEVSAKEIHPLVYTARTNLISLKVEGHEEYECILKDAQFDPITDEILHFDLIGLKRGEKIQLDVPVQINGSAVGVREGGILQQAMHKLDVECLPRDIPESIEIDISDLQIGDSVHVSDIKTENITILNPADSIIVSVTHPKVEKEVEVEGEEIEGEEPQEPEVIEKGKESEEEKAEN